MKKAFGSGISGAQVYWAGYSKNGKDWTKALRAAELDPENYVRKRTWTDDELIDIVKTLDKHKIPLNVLSLYNPSYGENLWAYCGVGASGQAFYRAGVRAFGSWDNLLLAAGLKPYAIRRHFWRKGNLSTVAHQEEEGIRWIGAAAQEPSEISAGREFLDRLQAEIAKISKKTGRNGGPSLR